MGPNGAYRPIEYIINEYICSKKNFFSRMDDNNDVFLQPEPTWSDIEVQVIFKDGTTGSNSKTPTKPKMTAGQRRRARIAYWAKNGNESVVPIEIAELNKNGQLLYPELYEVDEDKNEEIDGRVSPNGKAADIVADENIGPDVVVRTRNNRITKGAKLKAAADAKKQAEAKKKADEDAKNQLEVVENL
jgi:hypothetical protein